MVALLGPDPDYERRTLDFAREVLDSQGVLALRQCRLRIIWSVTGHGRMPVLILAFDLPEFAGMNAIPSLAVALVSVRKGTLLDLEPGSTQGTYLEGDRLRDHILRSVDDYLTKNGVRLSLDEDEAERFARG